jgi:hypothetical protein
VRQVVSPRRDPGWIIYISRASYQMLFQHSCGLCGSWCYSGATKEVWFPS